MDTRSTLPHTVLELVQAAEAVSYRLAQVLRPLGLTPSQYWVLEVLLSGSTNQRHIGCAVGRSSGNVTTVVDNLEKHGLALRTRGSSDRRQSLVSLTEEGRRRVERAQPKVRDELAALHAVLPEGDQERMQDAVRRLRRRAAERAGDREAVEATCPT